MRDVWSAPHHPAPVDAVVSLPGSKSLTARALVLAALAAEAERAGARIVKQATDAFWGGRSGYFADPDGFLWEIAWNPAMDFT